MDSIDSDHGVLFLRSPTPFRVVEDGVVLALPGSGDGVWLNATAARVWRELDRPRHLAELVNALRDDFEVSEEVDVVDVLATLLDQLLETGLVEQFSA